MKRIILIIVCIVVGSPAHAKNNDAKGGIGYKNTHNNYTRGYIKKNGTYINGYHHTKPDHTKLNNYSTKGNVDPYTGKTGTVDPNK